MAEKAPKAPGPSHIDTPLELAVIAFIALSLISSAAVWLSLNKDKLTSYYNVISYYFLNYFAKFAIVSALFSAAAVIVLAIYVHRYHKMREAVISKVLPPEGAGAEVFANENQHPKWKVVLDNINSEDPNKWKFAIIEADIILSDLLDQLELPGENMGDKLKAVDPSDFQSIEDAWEAHKIRNAIAHEGSDFMLSQREAKRVIGLYEKVFSEFEII